MMKPGNVIVLFALLLILSACSNTSSEKADGDTIPEQLQKIFYSEFPGAENVSWTASAGNYIVEFTDDGVYKELRYDRDGRLIQTKTETEISKLLPGIINFVNKNYPTFKIIKTIRLDRSDGIFYLLKINSSKENLILKFNGHGGFVNSMTEKKKVEN